MTYEEQLSAVKYRAERDQARRELERERRRRKLAESAAAKRDTVRAEDHEAAEWVREHGGIECLEEVESMSDLMGRVCCVIGVHNWEYVDRGEFEKAALGELKKRLIPSDMRWPRYEDGELVRIGSTAPFGRGGSMAVTGVELIDNGFILHGRLKETGKPCQDVYPVDQRVKRPQVLAADGEPLEAGQTVWHVEYGTEWCVTKAKDGKVFIAFEDFAAEECDPSLLTHQRPVLDADGVLIKKGDTVYGIETGNELVVDAFVEDGSHGPYTVDCHFAVGGEPNYYRPDKLTHTKPEPQDSWERIEEDAAMQPYAYCVGNGLFEECDEIETIPTNELFARDLVRRCKALAERGE